MQRRKGNSKSDGKQESVIHSAVEKPLLRLHRTLNSRSYWKAIQRFELYAQAFNLLNHANLGAFSGVQTSPFFGQATSAQSPRRMELGMRVNF